MKKYSFFIVMILACCFASFQGVAKAALVFENDKKDIVSAVKSGDIDTIKKIVARNPALLNAKIDQEGNTLLHLAATIENETIYTFLRGQGAEDTIKNSTGSTAKELSIPVKIFNLILLIDYADELSNKMIMGYYQQPMVPVLKRILEQQVAPTVIFGKHVLVNAVDSLDLSKWLAFIFSYKNLEGFLLIPKMHASLQLKKQSVNTLTQDDFVSLGFLLSDVAIKPINNKDEITALGKKIAGVDRRAFSRLVPESLVHMLSSDQKCIYVAGHGQSTTWGQSSIANLYLKDALKLFSTLDEKNTKLVYITTCFLGGKNLAEVQDSLNETLNKKLGQLAKDPNAKFKDPRTMIVISGATTDVATRQIPSDLSTFFDAFKTYLRKEKINEIKTLRAKRDYFAKYITPWLVGFGKYQDLSAFPQIRFPMPDARFYSLAPAVIDDIALGLARGIPFAGKKPKVKTLEYSNERLLVVDVSHVDSPIILKEALPLLIQGGSRRYISIDQLSVEVANCDIKTFVESSMRGSHGFFVFRPYEDVFFIKKLTLTQKTNVIIDGKEIQFPEILYNVFVSRSGKIKKGGVSYDGECVDMIFTLEDKEKTNGYYYKFEKIIGTGEESDSFYNVTFNTMFSREFSQEYSKYLSRYLSTYIALTGIDEKDADGNTPLHNAAQAGNVDLMTKLIALGADVAAVNAKGQTPLHCAALSKNSAAVKVLLDAQANVKAKNKFGITALHYAAQDAGTLAVVKMLVEAGANVNEPNDDNETPLFFAAGYGDAGIVQYLLDNKALVNVEDSWTKQTPLHAAAGSSSPDNLDKVKKLVNAQAKINVRDKFGRTPLFFATAAGNFTIVKYLVEEAKADITIPDSKGKTPLIEARDRKANDDILKLLTSEVKATATDQK